MSKRCTIVAEIGLSHDGSLGYCYHIAEHIKFVGADAIKFQCHDGDLCNKFRPFTSFPQDTSRQDYWDRTAFTLDQWMSLIKYCKNHALQVGISPFSVEAYFHIKEFADFIKIGSAQSIDRSMLSIGFDKQKPLVISTGLCNKSETAYLRRTFPRATLLQCTTEYPSTADSVGINVMKSLGEPYGLSDHSGTIWPSIIAAWEGASMIEVHVCWDKRQWGPDIQSSITVDELGQLVEAIRFVERMMPVDKDVMAENLDYMRKVFCT